MDDDLVRAYALEAQKAMEEEANRRIAEQTDAEEEERLRNTRIEDVVETITSCPFFSQDWEWFEPLSMDMAEELQSQNGSEKNPDFALFLI